jgi:hypothetical protein
MPVTGSNVALLSSYTLNESYATLGGMVPPFLLLNPIGVTGSTYAVSESIGGDTIINVTDRPVPRAGQIFPLPYGY